MSSFVSFSVSVRALIAVICVLVLGGCNGTAGDIDNAKIATGKEADESHKEGEGKTETAPVAVEIATVSLQNMAPKLELNGIVSALPDHMVKVTTALAGKLQNVLVTEGENVSKGQIVAVLIATHLLEQSKQLEANVQSANLAVKLAEENVAFAKDNLERQKGLFQAEVSAKKDIAAAQNQLDTASIQVQTAKANLLASKATKQQIETEIELTKIRAPIAGVVANRYLNVNDTADLNTPIIQIVGLDEVRINAALPADSTEQPFVGQSATICALSAPDTKYSATVKTISPVVDRTTNTVAVQLSCSNPAKKLKEGQNVKVVIATQKLKEVMTVPQTALVPDPDHAGSQMVYLIENDKVKRVSVIIGYSENGNTQIRSGLKVGQKVVQQGAYGLPDGASVKSSGVARE